MKRTAKNAKADAPRYRGKPYEADDKGTYHWRSDGTQRVMLANFQASITEDVLIDDGAEQQRAFQIECKMQDGQTKSILLPAAQFAAMNWPAEHLGARAIIHPSQREHFRTAIQMLSTRHAARNVYQHTGWRQTAEHGAIYLHAAGAIGARGEVARIETRLLAPLDRYTLPVPARAAAVEGLRASLDLIECAPAEISIPVYAAIWRAIIGDPLSFTVHLAGQTQSGKTAFAALCQQHFGAIMDADHLPGSWQSTANALEQMAFGAKDALFVVDDYVPAGTMQEQQRQNREADRLLRAQGNNAGRARMTAELQIRVAKPPRALLLSTGEDIPRGHSLRARMLIVEVARDSMQWAKISDAQAAARQGAFASATAGFIRWLAPRFADARAAVLAEVDAFRRSTAGAQARRTPDNIAQLAAGLRMVLTYAEAMNAITRRRASEIWTAAGQAFDKLADAQRQAQESADPTRAFIQLLGSAIITGRAHIAAPDGTAPEPAARWGYRVDDKERTTAQGERIGWTRDNAVYLEPRAAMAAAQKFGRDEGEHIPFTLSTLKRRLKQAGLLASTDSARESVTIRFTAEGARREVLHFDAAQFEEANQAAQPAAALPWSSFEPAALTATKPTKPTKAPKQVSQAGKTHPAPSPDKRNPQESKLQTTKPARSAAAKKDRKQSSVADPETLAAIRRFFPHTAAEFVSELRAQLNGHSDALSDRELAAAVTAAHKPDQFSARLFLSTVPALIRRRTHNPRNPAREILPAASTLAACDQCQDSGLSRSARYQTIPELRRLIAAGQASICGCKQGKTIEELCRED